MRRSIFLSASIPDPLRDARFFETMDVIAIRDAARALATVVLPYATLFWGGHPSITPLIRVVAESTGLTGTDRVRLYQSAFYSAELPTDNAVFESYVLTPRRETKEESLAVMRREMMGAAAFDAAVFIGGMEGVQAEFDLFRELHPHAPVFPIASTGAAARMIYDREQGRLNLTPRLLNDYAYPSLFRALLELPTGRGGSPTAWG